MSHWSDGYSTDIDYGFYYFAQLNPTRLAPHFLRMGLAVPKVATACELGFGFGLSTNIHAAASDTQWYGTDFNPNQALTAQDFAKNAGMADKVTLSDQGFAEFCYRDDLPDFDFIALHGIWSWISDENRMHIVDFIRRKLKVGGVLYISYNTLPGWSAKAPLRHLLSQIDKNCSFANQERQQAARAAIEQAQEILSLSSGLTTAAPTITTAAESLLDHSMNYIVHEYLNQNWQPMYFSEIESYLSQAKLSFACSDGYLDGFAEALYTKEQRDLLNNIPNPTFKETVKDYFKNTQFRKDFWVKGQQKLNRHEQTIAWNAHSVMLTTPPPQIQRFVQGTNAKINLLDEITNPLLEALPLYQPISVAKLREKLQAALEDDQLNDLLVLLCGKGDVVMVQDANTIKTARIHTDKLNHYILNRAQSNGQVNCLASPVTGGGFEMDRVYQLFTLAYRKKIKRKDWVEFVWQIFDSQGSKLLKDDKVLETPEDNLAHLSEVAEKFENELLPKLQALQIV